MRTISPNQLIPKRNQKNLTIKQANFVRNLIKFQSPTEAAMRSYNCKDRLSARNIASETLSSLGIKMSKLMGYMGLDTERDINDLKKLRTAKITKHFAHEGKIVDEATVDDNATQLKALDLSLRLKGVLSEESKSSSGDVHYHLNVIQNLHDKIRKTIEIRVD